MSSGARVQCPICPKTYGRLDHLHRHLANHVPWRTFVCDTCNKAFKRKDVLRRHSIMCHAHAGNDDDQTSAPARARTNRTACDRCARLKRACDSRQPCSNCTAKKELCSYAWFWGGLPKSGPQHALEAGNGSECSTPAISVPSPHTGTLQTTWSERRTQPHSFPKNCRKETHLSPDSLNLTPDGLDLWWAATDVSFQDNDFTTLAVGSDCVGIDYGYVESFSFFIRATRNGEGLGRTFVADTESLRETLSEPSLSGKDSDGLSEMEEYGGSLPYKTPYRPQGMQIFSETYWDDSADSASPINPGWSAELPPKFIPTPQCVVDGSEFQDSSIQGMRPTAAEAAHSGRFGTDCEQNHRHLAIKSHQIFTAIRRKSLSGEGAGCFEGTGADDWSPFVERECVDFFRPANLHRFLQYFWTLWYPNCPTIHKPTFDATTAPHQLLAAMALIGATLSPHANDNFRAKMWFDIVEKIVFSDETTYNLEEGSCTPCPPHRLEARLRALQASYAVCLYQNWDGRNAAKGRIRRQRYSMVISVARDLMCYANHAELDRLDLHGFSWEQFLLREEVIRSIMYVFLLDTAFIIFNNSPPRMVLREMTNDLACPEPCFQASAAVDCFHKIQQWISHPLYKKGVPFHAAVRSLRQETLDEGTKAYLCQCGVLNLWTIVSSFHSLLFNIDPGFGSEAQFETLRIAINNWRTVWNLRSEAGFSDCYGTHDSWTPHCMTEPEIPWKRIGFYRNAFEYWLLARVKLEKLESSRPSTEAEESLLGRENYLGTEVAAILSKFDETSMDQVNDLVTSFQSLRMHE
ncbi:hypothetical protein A1O1_03803 [Capronia coronata CBS 617.96]|uniref:Zn(2)-C6 fungal-type domain-containing protein n=1 Tax=Capronia coronata CBS 617.96 TaxID=1182541 RepID=W9Z846_9EURO|nr:uncharacterized protein A1O1_03803 [Capronia coronata CBS 617.96]EXJ90699.1 hypothetical protein A1O1_03803 [Capronia coronata CBS 617.96]